MLAAYLQKLHFTEKEQAIYLTLAPLGVQPASVIARRCNLDRVTVYKHLKKLAERGFVKQYFRDGVQCFGIENFDAIKDFLSSQVEEFSGLIETLPTALNILQSLKGEEQSVPRLQMFEGEAGIKALFRDIVYEMKQSKLRQVRILSGNTYEECVEDASLSRVVRSFFEDLREAKIEVELFEATGALVPERVRGIPLEKIDLAMLPIARGSTNIFVAGDAVYLASYKGNQVGVKMQHKELSQIFHFLFDLLGKG